MIMLLTSQRVNDGNLGTMFSEQVKLTGIHSGYYFCALNNYFNMLKLTINSAPGSELASAALQTYSPFISFAYGRDKGHIIPCINNSCYSPVNSPEELLAFMEKQGL